MARFRVPRSETNRLTSGWSGPLKNAAAQPQAVGRTASLNRGARINTPTYQIVNPPVSFRMYWPEVTLLLASISTPVVTWLVFHDGGMLGRSGSVVVFFAAVAEFFTL